MKKRKVNDSEMEDEDDSGSDLKDFTAPDDPDDGYKPKKKGKSKAVSSKKEESKSKSKKKEKKV